MRAAVSRCRTELGNSHPAQHQYRIGLVHLAPETSYCYDRYSCTIFQALDVSSRTTINVRTLPHFTATPSSPTPPSVPSPPPCTLLYSRKPSTSPLSPPYPRYSAKHKGNDAGSERMPAYRGRGICRSELGTQPSV